ncbi:MAG: cytochrome C peroxidase [Bdellovibrio sp. ArHS]|uniref:cytochrome-c peroxidase n=1 Tax=Bdellovibrio sp. ArHS TaxID=1569284 RepID=UPI0005829B93|nr:cytochrome-c peroxidase [Bdellovibrio sp. ArHS]KHD89796.1 MAG: cytochrome C peroxidase [Bdellovibrio sp. ArHS]
MKTSLLFSTLLFSVYVSSSFAQEALPEKVPAPAGATVTEEKILLGKTLYFDPRLSKDGTISCNSCHNVMAGGDDNRSFSAGVGAKLGGRSAPTVWNSAFMSVQFWDGRAASLEEQAKGPLTNPVEMAMTDHNLVISRIKNIPGYKALFDKAFGKNSKIDIDNVVKAIAAYERTLITPNARFDLYIKGDKKALREEEIKGFELMKTTGCFACHSGANFAGPTLPIGTGFYMKFPTFPGSAYDTKYDLMKDMGRFDVTKKDEDKHLWRVPTLRNIALTAPYFHNGSVAHLDEAVRVMAKTQLNKDLSKKEVQSIVAFLKTLTGERPVQTMPILPSTDATTLTP